MRSSALKLTRYRAPESVFQTVALQKILERALHMSRQRPLTRRQVLHERWVVAVNHLLGVPARASEERIRRRT